MFASLALYAQTIFINEIHYDNAGEDVNEGVEIAASAGVDLSCYEIHFYNGSNSTVYAVEKLSGIIEDQNDGFGFVWILIETNGFQNGGPDGLALYNSCTESLIQFLSYEGMITAADGPANGTVSENIGVEETNTAEIGTSLQLTGTGSKYADFVWSPSQPETPGATNVGQSFGESTTNGTTVNIMASNTSYSEAVGDIEIPIQITNVTDNFDLVITIGDGTATIDEDFTRSSEVINIMAADGANQNINTLVTLIDDEIEEEAETIVINFEIDNAEITLNKSSITITIEDNDAPKIALPQYAIEAVTTENADGVADSLDVKCQLTGVVQGINLFNAGGLLFTIHDGTAGIGIFNNNTDFEYVVTPGDEITVEGTIDQFNGLTQIAIDALTVNSSENDIQEFKEVSNLSENTESENVLFNGLSIIDESRWLGDGSSFNVEFETVNGETVIVRIDNNTPLANIPFSDLGTVDATFQVLGIGGQYDSEVPLNEGYQLFPMMVSDVMQVDVGIEEITLDTNINIVQKGANSFRITTVNSIQNIMAFGMNGKTIAVNQNENEFSLTATAKGIYLITFEMDKQTYSTKIFIK